MSPLLLPSRVRIHSRIWTLSHFRDARQLRARRATRASARHGVRAARVLVGVSARHPLAASPRLVHRACRGQIEVAGCVVQDLRCDRLGAVEDGDLRGHAEQRCEVFHEPVGDVVELFGEL
jgi:hypothetical protein